MNSWLCNSERNTCVFYCFIVHRCLLFPYSFLITLACIRWSSSNGRQRCCCFQTIPRIQRDSPWCFFLAGYRHGGHILHVQRPSYIANELSDNVIIKYIFTWPNSTQTPGKKRKFQLSMGADMLCVFHFWPIWQARSPTPASSLFYMGVRKSNPLIG